MVANSEMASVVCVGSGRHVRRAAEVLAAAEFQVATAPDIDAGVEAVGRRPPDCVVTALELPDGSGVDLACRVGDRVPVVVCAADGSESAAGEAVAAGAAGYVPADEIDAALVDRVRDAAEFRPPDSDPPAVAGDGQYARLFEQAPLPIVELGTDGTVVGWNSAAEDLFGYAAEEVVGRSTAAILPKSERDHAESVVARVLDGESVRSVHDNLTADGERITCRWHNTPLVAEGEVTGALAFAQDVTEEVRRAETLEALHWATGDLFEAADREEIARRVVTAAEGVLDAGFAAVYFHEDGFDPVAVTGAPEAAVPDIDDTEFAAAFERGHPAGVDRLSRSEIDGDALPVESLECHPLGEHGVLCFGVDVPGGIDAWTAKLGALLTATAEAALDRARRERRLRRASAIVEAVGDGVYALDPDGEIVAANDSLAAMTGYDREELVGTHVAEIVADDAVERGRRMIRDLLENDPDGVRTVELTFEGPDGQPVHTEVTISLLYSDGEFEGTVGIVRDVTERRRMERTLRERTAKIEGLHATAQRLEACRNVDAVFETAVEAAGDVLGFDRASIAQRDGDEIYTRAADHGDDLDMGPRANERSEPTQEAFRSGETLVVGDHERGNYQCSLPEEYRSALLVPFGEEYLFRAASKGTDSFDDADLDLAELLVAHVAEALDRIEYERDLRAERDRFAALFESVPDPVVRTRVDDETAVVLDANPAFERIFGYDAGEIRGESLDEHIVPPGRGDRAVELTRRGLDGELIECEVERMTTTGVRDFLLTVVPIDTAGDEAVTYAVYTDITERKQRQQRLEVLNRVLRHDLRNGMNIVQGGAEALADLVDGDALDHVRTIEERAEELIDLAEKTRVIERTLAHDPEEVGPVDVVDVVERAVDRFEGAAEFEVDLPGTLLARADDLLDVAVAHVVQNAVVHHDGEPSIRIRARRLEGPDAVELTVADDGPGIPEGERELVTEQREITQLHHASGLGLWLVNWVVTGAGGNLDIEDNDPRGTVVRITLPGAAVDAADAPACEESSGATD